MIRPLLKSLRPAQWAKNVFVLAPLVFGGQLLNLAVAGCISNDLFREAAARGIRLTRVRVVADSDYQGKPATSTPIEYRVEISGDASREDLDELVVHVDAIAEIPNSLRRGTEVTLTASVTAQITAPARPHERIRRRIYQPPPAA